MSRNIFQKRDVYKPFEYPDVELFGQNIQHSYWLFSEINFTADVQDFHSKLTPEQQSVIKNTLLAISQIEVAVKTFWSKIGDRFPKAEISEVGMIFAENETRHTKAYSHLLEVLGLNSEFANLLEVPAIKGRVKYLSKYLSNYLTVDNEQYSFMLTLFSLFVENVSLFSQFAIIKSFNKHLNVLKDVDNMVQATQVEEDLHGKFGAKLVNLIKEENPEWFNNEFYKKLEKACKNAYTAESAIIDWIFEKGELDFIPKDSLKEFIKYRFNYSLGMIGSKPLFEINKEKLSDLKWFDEELKTGTNTDFFHKRPTTYSKNLKPITPEDLF